MSAGEATKPTRGQRIKGIATTVFIVAFVFGFENAIYEWGYYRGHYAGQLQMKCAIFGVLDKMSDGAGQRDDRYSFVNLGCRNDAGRARAASADTHPKDGDAVAAPLVSDAVAESETPSTSRTPKGGES